MKKILIALGTAAVVLIAAFFALNHYIYIQKQVEEPGMSTDPYRATLTGIFMCLPHTDQSGPQTDECAFGIQTEAGEYYAVDFNLLSQGMPEVSAGDRLTATGLVTPIENLSSDHWRQYPARGIFSVTDSVSVNGRPVSPPSQASGPCYVGGCSSQLCTDEPDMASTCEYRQEYACYQGATCERQAAGQCGWTETATLRQCLNAAITPTPTL